VCVTLTVFVTPSVLSAIVQLLPKEVK